MTDSTGSWASDPRPLPPAQQDQIWISADDFGAEGDVGAFRQGTAGSRWALARYLVGRAVGESVGNSLLAAGLGLLVVAGLIEWAGATFWAVLVGILAVGVLVVRALLRAVLRHVTAVATYAPVEQRLRALVADTRKDVLRELRRVGLPGRTWTLPLLALRLMRRRSRTDAVTKLRSFDIDNVVPAARVDELFLLLRSGVGNPGTSAR